MTTIFIYVIITDNSLHSCLLYWGLSILLNFSVVAFYEKLSKTVFLLHCSLMLTCIHLLRVSDLSSFLFAATAKGLFNLCDIVTGTFASLQVACTWDHSWHLCLRTFAFYYAGSSGARGLRYYFFLFLMKRFSRNCVKICFASESRDLSCTQYCHVPFVM